MARITDANLAFAGQEPKFSTELTQSDLMRSLAWYAQNKDKSDAFKYACDYFKKKLKIDASAVLKSEVSTFGFVCRILTNGGSLPESNQIWFEQEIIKIKKRLDNVVVVEEEPEQPKITVNIQDRIREKASEVIGELEGQIDELILSKFEKTVTPYAIMHSMETKGVHVRHISDWFKTKRIEFDDVIHTDDTEVKEGWSNFTKPQLKKLVAYCDQVILDCGKISGESMKSRKPRKRKTKTPEQLTAKVKIMEEHKDLKLVSIPAKDIIGAMQLWVYNTKTRKLGVYHAIDADGLSVKSSSITNFNGSKSVQKTLRKPEATLPEIVQGGKVHLRNALEAIKAVETGLTGRLNADTILIRAIK